MSDAVHRGLVAAAPARPSFWRAAAARLTPRGALVVAVSCVFCELLIKGSWSQAPGPDHVPLLSQIILYGLSGTSLYLAVMAADEAVARGNRPLAAYATAVICGAALGAGLDHLVRDVWYPWHRVFRNAESLASALQWHRSFSFAIYGALATFVYVTLRSAREATTRHNERDLARQRARRRTLESRLSAMQARIEPQFLFNTLGQVRSLYDVDAARGGAMLDHLIDYLRAALPQLRDTASTLGREVALARAYLEIVRMRLGERLDFSIAVAEPLASAHVPPMMLLPLVEHALADVGDETAAVIALRIDAEVDGGALRLVVAASGTAFSDDAAGERLRHIGERLQALHGGQARLRLERAAPAGSRAVLEIPHEQADRSDR